MKVLEKIKAFFKRIRTFFKRGKAATTTVKPAEPAAEGAEKKTIETSASEGTKEQDT